MISRSRGLFQGFIMDARNPKYNADGSSDLEIEHPDFGWLPLRHLLMNPEEFGRTMHTQVLAGAFGTISPYVAPQPTLCRHPRREKAPAPSDC